MLFIFFFFKENGLLCTKKKTMILKRFFMDYIRWQSFNPKN